MASVDTGMFNIPYSTLHKNYHAKFSSLSFVSSEIASSSSNIISSTQDSPYQQPTPNGYPTSDHSNRGYNECGQQYCKSSRHPFPHWPINFTIVENSVPIISNTKMANGSGLSSSETAGTPALQSMSRTLRPHSTPATLLWLEDNYELAEGVCIPRSVLYLHYVDFCANNSVQPVNAASFGKVRSNISRVIRYDWHI